MFSHTFKAHEVNWSAHDKELFAIVHAFDHYRHFLEGVKNPVKVYSDHRALSHFMTTTDLSRKDRHRRWAEILMPHRFTIEYRPGQANKVADGPSRYNFDDVHYEDFPLLPPSRFSEKALEIGTIDCVITHLGQNEPLCLGLQWLRQVNPKLVELLQNLGGGRTSTTHRSLRKRKPISAKVQKQGRHPNGNHQRRRRKTVVNSRKSKSK